MALRFDELSPREFEELCLALLHAEGYSTRHLGAAGSDGGSDGRATAPDGRLVCVQCKRETGLALQDRCSQRPSNGRPSPRPGGIFRSAIRISKLASRAGSPPFSTRPSTRSESITQTNHSPVPDPPISSISRRRAPFSRRRLTRSPTFQDLWAAAHKSW